MSYSWVQNSLHPFIIYTIFGTIIGYAIISLIINRKPGIGPKSKSTLLLVPMLVPFVAYLIAKVFSINPNCLLTGIGTTGLTTADSVVSFICSFSTAAAWILTPMLFLAIAVAFTKGLVSIVMCRKLIKNKIDRIENRELEEELARLSDKLKIRMPLLVITPVRYAQSFTFGWKRPVIVLSQGLIDSLDQEEVQGVLAHELAHIYNGDNSRNWLSVFIRDLLFFTPLAYWGLGKILLEREKAADELAVRLTGKPYPLAQALIKVWRLSPKGIMSNWTLDNFSPNPGFLKVRNTLTLRVERVLANNFQGQEENSNLVGITVLLLVTAVILIIC